MLTGSSNPVLYALKHYAKNVYRWFFNCPDTLSYSKISTFISCSLKYNFQYKKKWPTRITGPLTFGSVIHKVMEVFHRQFDIALATEDDLLDLLEEYWSSEGFASKEEEEKYKERAKRLFARYLAEAKANPPDVWRTELHVESSIGGFPVSGRMDRIDRLPDGGFGIVDYKTGEKIHSEEHLQSDLQANIYYMLGEATMGRRFRKFDFWYLEHGRKVPVTITDEARAETARLIKTVAHKMQFADPKPKKGVLCNWCDYYEKCPAWSSRPERLYKEVRESEDRMGLSYSKMSQFLNCPEVYKKVYLEKVPPKPKGFFAIGHTFHQTMEEFYMYDGPLAEPTLEWLLKLYHEHWIGRGYASREEEEAMKRDGEQWMQRYYEMYVRGQFKKGTYEVETYFELPLGRHAIIGYIDRLNRNDDGSYSLVDYKTDPVMRTMEEVKKDKQLYLYAWACKKLGIQLKDQTLIFVKFGKHVTVTHSERDVAEFAAEVERTANEMVQADNAFKRGDAVEIANLFPPKINKYCGGCDYLATCPKRAEILSQRDKIMHAIDETKLADLGLEGAATESEPEAPTEYA